MLHQGSKQRVRSRLIDATESSGSQFYIMTSDADVHYFDGDYTVFGVLVDGASVVDELAAAPAEGESPTNPATITSTEILE